MATLAVTTPDPATGGTLTTVGATAAGDAYPNSGKESLVVINGSGGNINVTFVQQKACSDGFATPTHDIVVEVAAGDTEYLAPVSPTYYNDANDRVVVTYSSDTSITVGVIKTN